MSENNAPNFTCAAATERMHEYLDGELPENLTVAMASHLETCPECAKVFHQLRQIEEAHRQSDARLESPSEEYWQALPQRVMERVKASERRRILAMPRLSRSRSAAAPSYPAGKHQTGGLLYLPPRVRAFINGPGKYALALAAVAAFCFFMIRELRQKPDTLITTRQALESEVPSTESKQELSTTAPSPAVLTQAPEAPAETRAAAAREEQPPPEAVEMDKLLADTGTEKDRANAERAAASKQGAFPAASSESARATTLAESAKPRPTGANVEHAEPVGLSQPEQLAQLRREAADLPSLSKAKSAAAEPAAPGEQALSVTATPGAQKRAYSASSARREALSPEASYFYKLLARAEQTSDLQEREKIWRRFLSVEPDSTYHALAVFHLAKTLVAASDSSSSPAQLEQNLVFLRENARLIRSQMGHKEFDRELARLQALLNRR
jgi:anti-sigma factor RsiW